MRIKFILLSLSCAALFSSCAVTLPYVVTNNSVGTKTGTSTTVAIGSALGARASKYSPNVERTMYQGIVLNKDFGIVDAAKEGNISKIGAVDMKITNYVLFSKLEWIVTGE